MAKRSDSAALRRLNAFSLRFFGPPHLGDLSVPPPTADPDPACPHCRQRESAHESYRTRDGKTLRRCPA